MDALCLPRRSQKMLFVFLGPHSKPTIYFTCSHTNLDLPLNINLLGPGCQILLPQNLPSACAFGLEDWEPKLPMPWFPQEHTMDGGVRECFPGLFCCRAPAAMIPISLLTSLLSLQPLSLGNESQASLWVSLRACKFLRPIRTEKKESIFLSYPLSWPLGTNPKPRAVCPSQAPRYQHPCASQGSLVVQEKQHLRGHCGIS